MQTKFKLTKIGGEKSPQIPHQISLKIGESLIGCVDEGSIFPDKPTIGKAFFLCEVNGEDLNYYKTSVIDEILPNNTFKTADSIYQWSYYN